MRQPVPFGKYLLLDRISVGGMAEVFKAKSYGVEGFEKIIAIKRILPTMGEDRDFIKMFIDEAKIAGQLAHANICQIFELGRIDGSHFIAMEYIWGKDLLQIQNRLRKLKQPMPIPMACFSIAKVLEGLDYAHRKRDPLGRPLEIVHRDCSPQNVLVSYEGEVKVIDFGIAKATSRNSRTMAGVLKGKFGYMSPEQVRGLPLDRRSDIFALGTMLYECLTSDRLFQGETDFSTLEKVRNVDVRPPREINPNIPPAVEAVIMKALAKDVEERYQWCSEMLADLQAFLMSQDVVFTAKSLSSWLKEVFAPEIDRERQQLEQYKRVGRDGLIAGVPAAEARVDIVDTLGEAPPVEGDPTVLGGPNFEDVEQIAGASPEVGPAPGSPAARGASEADAEDFGEEAPTEIFGEIDHGANPALAAAAGVAGRAPGATPSPTTRPPKPPPSSRAPTSRGDLPNGAGATVPDLGFTTPVGAPLASPGAPPIATGTPGGVSSGPPTNGAPANPGQGRTLIGAMAPPGLSSYLQGQGAQGMTGAPPPGAAAPTLVPGQAFAPGQAPGAPLPMGAPAPLPQLLQPGPTPHMPVPTMLGTGHPGQPGSLGHPGQPMMPMQMYPGQGPGQMHGQMPGQMYGQMPGQMHGQGPGQMHGQGPGQMHGQMPGQMYGQMPGQMPGMPSFQGAPPYMPQPPYGAPNPYAPVPPLEQLAHAEGKKKSSIARDVAIGVAIAALVLGGFLAVKFLLLDGDSAPTEPAAAAPSFAKVRTMLTGGDAANLFLDDKLHATVRNNQEFDVQPGQRKVKLVGPSGVCFEQEMTLVAGKVATLSCALAPAAGSAAPASGAAGSGAPAAGSGTSAGDAAGSGATPAAAAGSAAPAAAGSGAPAAGAATPEHPADHTADHPVPDKTDKMPVEDTAKPSSGDRPAAAAHHAADRPADKHAAKPAPADDDLGLGKLQGGVKPGDKKPGKR